MNISTLIYWIDNEWKTSVNNAFQNPLPGFHAGGFYNGKIAENFYFQPEIQYALQGKIYNVCCWSVSSSQEIRFKAMLYYLNIPLLTKYYPSERFHLDLGPYIGFLLDSKTKKDFETNQNPPEGIKTMFTNIKYSKGDLGLTLGAGYEFSNGFNGTIRFNYGLAGIDDESRFLNLTRPIMRKNMALQFSVGYRLFKNK